MKIVRFSLLAVVFAVAGCVTPVSGQWYNNFYKHDFENTMEKYYGRDFSICLKLAVEATADTAAGVSALESETDKCLRRGGWFRVAEK